MRAQAPCSGCGYSADDPESVPVAQPVSAADLEKHRETAMRVVAIWRAAGILGDRELLVESLRARLGAAYNHLAASLVAEDVWNEHARGRNSGR